MLLFKYIKFNKKGTHYRFLLSSTLVCLMVQRVPHCAHSISEVRKNLRGGLFFLGTATKK